MKAAGSLAPLIRGHAEVSIAAGQAAVVPCDRSKSDRPEAYVRPRPSAGPSTTMAGSYITLRQSTRSPLPSARHTPSAGTLGSLIHVSDAAIDGAVGRSDDCLERFVHYPPSHGRGRHIVGDTHHLVRIGAVVARGARCFRRPEGESVHRRANSSIFRGDGLVETGGRGICGRRLRSEHDQPHGSDRHGARTHLLARYQR